MTICKGNEPWADKFQLTVFFCHDYGMMQNQKDQKGRGK